jgi:hypothetical protein
MVNGGGGGQWNLPARDAPAHYIILTADAMSYFKCFLFAMKIVVLLNAYDSRLPYPP